MTGVLGYARTFFQPGVWQPDCLDDFDDEAGRFHAVLEDLGSLLERETPRNGISPEQLLQEPLADAMTHVGQLAMLRRLAGSPVPSENSFSRRFSAVTLVQIKRCQQQPILVGARIRRRRRPASDGLRSGIRNEGGWRARYVTYFDQPLRLYPCDRLRNMKSGDNPGRVAGFLYLLLGFAVVRLQYIPGALLAGRDAADTTRNIAAHELLFRFGIVSDLITATAAIFVTLALYRLFEEVDRSQAVLLVILGGPMPAAVYFCNALNDVAALMFARPADFVAAFEKPQREAFVMLFLRLHDYGVFANEIFWGLWLFPFGLLVWRSGFIPRILGIFLFIACFGYLAFSFTGFLMPQYMNTVARVANIAILGEAPIILWLVIMGAKPVGSKNRSPAAPALL